MKDDGIRVERPGQRMKKERLKALCVCGARLKTYDGGLSIFCNICGFSATRQPEQVAKADKIEARKSVWDRLKSLARFPSGKEKA